MGLKWTLRTDLKVKMGLKSRLFILFPALLKKSAENRIVENGRDFHTSTTSVFTLKCDYVGTFCLFSLLREHESASEQKHGPVVRNAAANHDRILS